MSVWWEAPPLAALAGATLFCLARWRRALTRSIERGRMVEELSGYLDSYRERRWSLFHQKEGLALICADLEDRLRQIEQQRHNAAKKARQAQLAQQRAKVLAVAAEMVAEAGRKAA